MSTVSRERFRSKEFRALWWIYVRAAVFFSGHRLSVLWRCRLRHGWWPESRTLHGNVERMLLHVVWHTNDEYESLNHPPPPPARFQSRSSTLRAHRRVSIGRVELVAAERDTRIVHIRNK